MSASEARAAAVELMDGPILPGHPSFFTTTYSIFLLKCRLSFLSGVENSRWESWADPEHKMPSLVKAAMSILYHRSAFSYHRKLLALCSNRLTSSSLNLFPTTF